ncbi:MAG: EI24 domain-containing protein [Acetobacteraceae bacterium]|nr:EI24 domain-containing protein [Acetobacteraceae bacterium]
MTQMRPSATLLAIGQLDDPAFLGAVLRSAGWALLALATAAAGLAWGGVRGAAWLAADWPTLAGWLEWVAGVAGVAGAAVLGLFLFVPLATGIATLFVDRVAEAVERRHFPDLPPAVPASLAAQAWDGTALALLVLGMQLLALLVAVLLPGLGLLVGWLVAAWAIGRGLFMAVALRRCNRAAALALYRRRRFAVVVQGGLVAAAGLVPGLNLVAPVLGLAAMVHILGRDAPIGGRIYPPLGLSGRPPAC